MICHRCGRPVRSTRALATGYGEHCRRRVYRAAKVLAASNNKVALKAAILLYRSKLIHS